VGKAKRAHRHAVSVGTARTARLCPPYALRHFRPEIERRIDQYAANPHPDPVAVAAE